MEEKKPRLLKAEEIEVKIKKLYPTGAVALLYKTARVDMDILDETFGPDGWSNDYKEIKGNLYCGIRVGDVWKWDCGIESREDNEGNQKKGEASDAFKRAGFRWGIGRELYTAPPIWLPREKLTVQDNKVKDTLWVQQILYDDSRRISALAIKSDKSKKGEWAFLWKAQS